MRYRRSGRRRQEGGSYFTSCKWCGERIHMRQMPHGQWVAFGGADAVHRCPDASEYGTGPSVSRQGGGHSVRQSPPRNSAIPPPVPSSLGSSLSPSRDGAVAPDPLSVTPRQPKVASYSWIWWVIGLVIVVIALNR